MSKQSILRTIVDRNVERLLVREFLMKNTSKSGFGGLDIRRTPGGTEVTVPVSYTHLTLPTKRIV